MIFFQLLTVFLVVNISLASDCVKRTYTADSFVCVCDADKCDRLAIEKTVKPGYIAIYDSDQKSDRLEKTIVPVGQLKNRIDRMMDNKFTLNINVKHLNQKILGFGGCFTDGAVLNIASLSNDLVKSLMYDYFGENGLEYNIGRVPIGASDSSTHAYSLDDTPFDFTLSHFALAEEDIKYRIPFLRIAKMLNPEFRAFASAWSSPAWMKTTLSFKNGELIGKPGDVYYKLWAQYYVKYLNTYLDHGVKFWGLTTLNNPPAGLRGAPWGTLGMTPEQLRDFVKLDLGPALKAAGWGRDNLTLMIHDAGAISMDEYLPVILNDPEAAKYVKGIAYHWYDRKYPWTYGTISRFIGYGAFLFSSEAGNEGVASEHLGDWGRAEAYALDIIAGLQHWSTGWTDWALAVDTAGGPNWAKNWVDATIVVNATAQEYYKNPMYYALAHFTKFLPIGSTHVETSVENARRGVYRVAFITSDNTLVLILLNMDEYEIDLTINGFAKVPFTTTLKPRSIRNMLIALN
ncbi:putative glucosylceramidase 3 [Tetranychus urticae]|uniref:Glucosylceramidase n=1 Tax=Tetranychus urticae TaxID=32264 RepID=T1KKT6_TETUR|nr:putative glucosylceramidase 3 [Tetranychus urticae]